MVKVDEIPDESSQNYGKPFNKEDPIIKYLKTGNTKLLQDMIDNGQINVDDYAFGGDKTVLHEAVQISDSPDVIDLLLKNKADVNAIEKETGNTALFLASLDLKVELVKVILKYRPHIQHTNFKGQDVFAFLNENLIEKKGVKKTDLTKEQLDRLQDILEQLKSYKQKDNVEDLDEERKHINRNLDDSGDFRVRHDRM